MGKTSGTRVPGVVGACLVASVALTSCDAPELTAPQADAALLALASLADLEGVYDPLAVIEEEAPEPRFTISAELVGDAVLGSPIEFRVTTLAHFNTPNVLVTAIMPELQVATANEGRMVDWVGVAMQPDFSASSSLSRNGNQVDEFTVTIPYPGYWRVVVSARFTGTEDPRARGTWVQDVVHKEFWLYLDHNGMATSDGFDKSLFPDSVDAAPGPIRYRTSGRPAGTAGVSAAGPALSVESSQFRVQYYNTPELEFQPVAGVPVKGWYNYPNGSPALPSLHHTDSDGYFTLDCNTSYDYLGNVDFYRNEFDIGQDAELSFIACETGWDDPGVVTATSLKSQVWRNLDAAMDESAGLFSQTRSSIPVIVTTNTGACASTACYTPGSSDKITIEEGGVWGDFGTLIAAHEYGHAFHEKALGGNEGHGSCPSSHFVLSAYNLKCAFSEGFANFYGALTNQDLLADTSVWEDVFERPLQVKLDVKFLLADEWCIIVQDCPSSSQQTMDGARVEAALAAFLYDLADDANTANNQPTSDDDAVSYGAQYVADVVQTCQVKQGATWIRANGLDHLVYCFEKRLSNYASQGYFPTRSTHPTDWSTSASTPSGWNANTIKTIWQGIAFAEGPPVAPLTAYIAGVTELEAWEPCSWQAIPTGGVTPYTYSWTGALTGTSNFVSGSLGSSDYLYLTVTSTDSQSVITAPHYISIFSGAEECVE